MGSEKASDAISVANESDEGCVGGLNERSLTTAKETLLDLGFDSDGGGGQVGALQAWVCCLGACVTCPTPPRHAEARDAPPAD